MWKMIIKIIEFIFDIILCEIDIILIFELLNRSYGKIKKYKNLIYSLAILATFLSTIYFHCTGNTMNIFCNIIIYCFIISFYPSTLKKTLLFSLSLFSLSISSLLILNDITNILPKGWIVFGLLCYHIAFWGILFFSTQFNNDLYAEIPTSLWIVLYSIPTLCIINTLFAIFLTRHQNTSLQIASLYHLPIQITLFIINLLVFILYAEFSKFHFKSKENALLLQQIEYQNEHFKILEESWNKIREMRHDMKNQLKTALFLYKKNSHEKLIAYLDDSLNHLSDIEEIIHTGNLEIDALINIKLNELEKLNINCTTDILIPSNFLLPVNHIIIILGNLFDNAKEACENLPHTDRNIEFTLHFMQNSLYINMKNPYSGDFSLTTKKQDNFLHGLGLKNIQKVVSEYSGIISYDTQNNIFSIDIILYLHNKV